MIWNNIMTPLIINSTNSTPKVTLDKSSGTFRFEGISRPENVLDFYNPILNWLEEYLKAPNKETVIEFALEYHNSASAKIVCKMLHMLEPFTKKGTDIRVKWYYREVDDDILEAGEDYQALIDIPFEIIKTI